MIRLTSTLSLVAAAPSDGEEAAPSRSIAGVAVPYDVVAQASTGPVMFLAGSLPEDGKAPKLFLGHDATKAVGIVTSRTNTPAGMLYEAKVSETQLGTEALTLAQDGVIDGVSVGVNIIEAETIDGITVIAQADWVELSMTPTPAFSGATIDRVAATADPNPQDPEDPDPSEEETMTPDPTTEATVSTPPLTFARPRKPITASRYIAETLAGGLSPDVQAVIAQDSSGDVPGVVPELLVGSIWDSLAFGEARPVISALGTYAMPGGGESFYRRKVTGHTTVATQANEFDELASSQYTVDRIQVNKVWQGGTLSVSEQASAYADQNLLDLIINDMSREYAISTNAYVSNFISEGLTNADDTISDFTDGDDVIAALYGAAAQIKANTRLMPTHLLVSTAIWAQLGQAKTAAGQYIFPYLNPQNTFGQASGVTSLNMNPLGLALVVTDDLTYGNECVIMTSRAIEIYEDRRGALRVESPSTLSTTLAFRGVIACANININGGVYNLVNN